MKIERIKGQRKFEAAQYRRLVIDSKEREDVERNNKRNWSRAFVAVKLNQICN